MCSMIRLTRPAQNLSSRQVSSTSDTLHTLNVLSQGSSPSRARPTTLHTRTLATRALLPLLSPALLMVQRLSHHATPTSSPHHLSMSITPVHGTARSRPRAGRLLLVQMLLKREERRKV